MALYAISDLHLPLGVDKPMDIFGENWKNYVERLRNNWQSVVKPEDVVVLPGDFSWATYIEDAKRDFDFLHELNGKKILLKGNHDYWWETLKKMKNFAEENGYDDISFLQNTCIENENFAICGTRGWNLPTTPNFKEKDKKIYEHELIRLEMSLSAASENSVKIVFLHYPPVTKNCTDNEFVSLMKKYGVETCVYGHLHANSAGNALTGNIDVINYLLVSCDYLDFMPVKLSE